MHDRSSTQPRTLMDMRPSPPRRSPIEQLPSYFPSPPLLIHVINPTADVLPATPPRRQASEARRRAAADAARRKRLHALPEDKLAKRIEKMWRTQLTLPRTEIIKQIVEAGAGWKRARAATTIAAAKLDRRTRRPKSRQTSPES